MPKPNDTGKVIVSLLAGATAGIVAGLLLAPETGDDARKNLRDSAKQWGGSLGKLVQGALAKFQPPTGAGPDAAPHEGDRSAADALFHSMNAEPGDLSTPATGNGRTIAGNDAGPTEAAGSGYVSSDGSTRHPAM